MLPSYEDKVLAGTLAIAARPRVVRDGPASAVDRRHGRAGLSRRRRRPCTWPWTRRWRMAWARWRCAIRITSVPRGLRAHRRAARRGRSGHQQRQWRHHGPDRAAPCPCWEPTPSRSAAPAACNEPFVLDMATTTVAANKVKVYDFHGKPLPPGWAVDGRGEPVTDAAQAMAYIFKHPEGGLSPWAVRRR